MLMQSATPLGALENATEFLPRHIGIDAADEAHMLSVIGEASVSYTHLTLPTKRIV